MTAVCHVCSCMTNRTFLHRSHTTGLGLLSGWSLSCRGGRGCVGGSEAAKNFVYLKSPSILWPF